VRRQDGAYGVFNLGNSQTVELSEMIATIAGEMAVEPRIRELPMQPGDVLRTYADISRAREAFGYEPTTDFRQGVRRFLDWFSEAL